jgi:hypothetical protein
MYDVLKLNNHIHIPATHALTTVGQPLLDNGPVNTPP